MYLITMKNHRLFVAGLAGSLLAASALAQPAKPAAETMAPSTVIVSGPAGQVTLAEVRMLVDEQVPAGRQPAFWASPQSIGEAARNLYGNRALAQQALKEGLDRQPGAAAFLALQREKALAEWLMQQRARARTGDPKVLEQFARTAYKAEPERFRHMEQVRLRHIMVVPEREDKEGVMAKRRAEALLAEVSKGADFEKLAREKSEDRNSALKGGDLGVFDVGGMLPEFDAQVAKMKPGQISGPVRTKEGYHLIQLVDRRPAGTAPFEEVAPLIHGEAKEKVSGDERRRVWQEVANAEAVKFNDAALSELARPPAMLAPAKPK